MFDLRKSGVKLVVAAPGVPVGDYTRIVLHNLQLDDALKNVVSNESDVREVLAKVALGEADAGFVYTTDARTIRGKVATIGIRWSAQPIVQYAVAVVKRSKHVAAARYYVKELLGRARGEASVRRLPLEEMTRRIIAAAVAFGATTVVLGFLVLPIVAIFARVSPANFLDS